jgi:putative transposase
VFLRFDPRDITMLLVYSRHDGREKFIARAYAVGLEADQLSLEEVKHSVKKLKKAGKQINNVAIREETIRRRKLFASKQNVTRKIVAMLRKQRQIPFHSVMRRISTSVSPKPPVEQSSPVEVSVNVSALPVEEQTFPVEVLVSPPEPVVDDEGEEEDDEEDYSYEVDYTIERMNYNGLR